MGVMHAMWSVIVGFVVGLLARAVVPGADRMGFLGTVALGILGSLVGGFIGSMVSKPAEGSKFHMAGFLMSIVGAVVLLLVWRSIR